MRIVPKYERTKPSKKRWLGTRWQVYSARFRRTKRLKPDAKPGTQEMNCHPTTDVAESARGRKKRSRGHSLALPLLAPARDWERSRLAGGMGRITRRGRLKSPIFSGAKAKTSELWEFLREYLCLPSSFSLLWKASGQIRLDSTASTGSCPACGSFFCALRFGGI
jgi:hypothetical protein